MAEKLTSAGLVVGLIVEPEVKPAVKVAAKPVASTAEKPKPAKASKE
jgi:hypothetical protein